MDSKIKKIGCGRRDGVVVGYSNLCEDDFWEAVAEKRQQDEWFEQWEEDNREVVLEWKKENGR